MHSRNVFLGLALSLSFVFLTPVVSSAQSSGATYSWSVSEWSSCSSSVQTRTVVCRQNVGNFITPADDSWCSTPKPATTLACSVSANTNGALPASNFTWVEAKQDLGTNARWTVGMSSDGQTIVSPVEISNDYTATVQYGHGGHIDISRNGGATFQNLVGGTGPLSHYWKVVALSADAMSMAVTTNNERPDGSSTLATSAYIENSSYGYIYTSNDGGASWTRRDGAGRQGWADIKMSPDGTIIVAVTSSGRGPLRISRDAGRTWATLNNDFYAFGKVAMNSDGSQILVSGVTSTFPQKDQISISRNGGTTWEQSLLIPGAASGAIVAGIYSSLSGQDLSVIVNQNPADAGRRTNRIFVSHNAGRSWTEAYSQRNTFRGGAMSSDGTTIVAVDISWDSTSASNLNPDGIFYHAVSSIDGGLTWQSNILPKHYYDGAAISSDGRKIVVVNTGGGIEIGTRTGGATPTTPTPTPVQTTTPPVTPTTPGSTPITPTPTPDQDSRLAVTMPISQIPPTPARTCVNLTHSFGPDDEDADVGGDVTRLQNFLASAGYYTAAITGYVGPRTVRAIQAWQRVNGPVSSGDPDSNGFGYIGRRTRALLSCTGTTNTFVDTAPTPAPAPVTPPTPTPAQTNTPPIAPTPIPVSTPTPSPTPTTPTPAPTPTTPTPTPASTTITNTVQTALSAAINASALAGTAAARTLSGTAANLNTVVVALSGPGFSINGQIPVINGTWSWTPSALPIGSYIMRVLALDGRLLTSGQFSVAANTPTPAPTPTTPSPTPTTPTPAPTPTTPTPAPAPVGEPAPATTLLAPVATPGSGTYTGSVQVSLAATGANSMRYTTDGTNPSCTSGSVYSTALTFTTSTTLKAIACPATLATMKSSSVFSSAILKIMKSMFASALLATTGDGSVLPSSVAAFVYTIQPAAAPAPTPAASSVPASDVPFSYYPATFSGSATPTGSFDAIPTPNSPYNFIVTGTALIPSDANLAPFLPVNGSGTNNIQLAVRWYGNRWVASVMPLAAVNKSYPIQLKYQSRSSGQIYTLQNATLTVTGPGSATITPQ